MAVRSQHSRQSKNYIIEVINGTTYYIEPNTYVSKSVIYQAKNKIINGKIQIPQEIINIASAVLVVCNGNGNYQFSILTRKQTNQ